MRITSITPMKNEAPYLLEWVAYHRLIGVNDMIVFSNHCTDGTNLMLERMDELGLLRHFTNPSVYTQHTKHHQQIFRYVNTWDRLARSDWVVSLDVDEFICVNTGKGILNDLFDAVPNANMICMSQHNFGSSGREFFDPDLTTRQFTQSWSYDKAHHVRANKRGVKTLTHRSSVPKTWHNHSPVFYTDRVNCVTPVNGSGKELKDIDLTKSIKSLSAPYYGFELVQLNHYAIRSAEAFLLKATRGNANHISATYDMPYWRKYDSGRTHDVRIQRWSCEIEAQKREFLQDAELATLERAALNRAFAKIQKTRQTAEGSTLLRRIRRYQTKKQESLPKPA